VKNDISINGPHELSRSPRSLKLVGRGGPTAPLSRGADGWASRSYQTRFFIKEAAHELFKLTNANEYAPDSPFEGSEGVVSVPDWTFLSTKGQPLAAKAAFPLY